MIIKLIKFIIRKILKKKILKENSLSKKFTKIYKINYWSEPETVSGPGSALRNTTKLISKINNIIDEYNIKSIVDAPCGDLSWMKKILSKRKIKYTGIDIVGELIKKNNTLYADKNINFYKIDITKKKNT